MLQDFYTKNVVPKLMKDLGYTNPMMVPKIEKIVLNTCLAEATQNPKVLDVAAQELGLITGQKPALRKAKKAISNFKLRQGIAIGCMVTLRRKKMYEFLNRLINVALPRARDFKGLPKRGFDGRGNYNMGITEQVIFPEIQHDKVDKMRGMNVTIVTSAKTDKEAEALLRSLGLPLRT